MPKLDALRLKNFRRQAELTQKQLASAANISYSSLTKLEQGTVTSPSITVVTDLATALGCDLSDLLENYRYRLMPNPDIDFVYFDVGGVLVHWLPSLHAFAERIHRSDDAVKKIFYEHNAAGCRGKMTLEELQLLTMLRLNVPYKSKLPPNWIDDMKPIEQSHIFISSLIKHYKTGLLTNVFKGYYPDFFERGLVPNLPYKTVVKSCDVGFIKPEREMYELATQVAQVAPEKILFIDDSKVNVRAAKDFGWQAEWFDEYRPQASILRIIRRYFSNAIE